jgi:serine/threonine-protein kinase
MICPACGAENDDSADNCFKCGKGLYALTEGALLASRYEILSHLGRGGMGIVYKAHDRSLDEVVALKVLRFDVARSGDVARRFRSEIKLARKVRHRNVCGIHEYGEDGPYRFIVMELIEGMDLRRILREKGAFPPREACALAIEITEGLQAIHDVGIVHRDLKSPNVMLDKQGRVRLMDFGIAKQTGANVTAGDATATGLVLGTPEYMSPEQARGKKIDFRSDIYALGVMAYELFSGHVPFKGETPLETIFKHLQEAPVFAGPQAPGIPEPFVPVLGKALAKAPEERYGTAREMAGALRQAAVETFGAPLEPGTAPIFTATAPDTHRFPQTQTIPTPTPLKAPTAVPTPTPAAAPSTPPTALPEPTVATGEGLAPTTVSKPPSAPAGRRTVWIAGGAVAAVACIAGVLYLRSGSGAPGASPSIPGSDPTLSPGLSATGGEPTPSATAEAPARDDRATDVSSTPTPGGAAVRSTPAAERSRVTSPPAPRREPARRPPPQSRPAETRTKVAPAPRPTATPTPTPTPAAPRPPQAAAPVATTGVLQFRILPWADVTLDGTPLGTTPLRPVTVEAGEHRVVLTHPGYKPLQKTVVVRADETTTLEVDLSYEAFPR